MPQKDLQDYYLDLASKYLSGNASDGEVKELEDWVSADPENRQAFLLLKKAWMLSGIDRQQSTPDTGQRWRDTARQLFGDDRIVEMKPRTSRRRWMSIAATIALLAVVATVIFLQPWGGRPMLAKATDESKTIELRDGSQVVLNRASTLAYSFDQETATRRVELSGDAFFDVARDEAKPFVVQSGAVQVEVLGTSFYVDAREGQPQVQVIVESGRVAVRQGEQEAILEAGEMAVFQIASQQLAKQAAPDQNFRALKTDTLQFDNTRLEEVVFALNRYYHAEITIGTDELKDCRLNSTFSNKSLEAVLLILQNSFDLQVTRNGDGIVLTGTCVQKE